MTKLIARISPLLLLAAIAFLLARRSLLSWSPFVIAGQVAALALNVWARRSFRGEQFRLGADPGEGGLVERGPYRLIRHPMYASALLFLWSSILGHWSLVNALVGTVITVILPARIVIEERLVLARYPEYAEYRRRTKRLIPFVF
jgi:protein-S-isoprenylcysteine O-methyltransferase Ste14